MGSAERRVAYLELSAHLDIEVQDPIPTLDFWEFVKRCTPRNPGVACFANASMSVHRFLRQKKWPHT
jgi:hypothetical protein